MAKKNIPFKMRNEVELGFAGAIEAAKTLANIRAVGALQGGTFDLDGNDDQNARTLQLLRKIEIFEIPDEI